MIMEVGRAMMEQNGADSPGCQKHPSPHRIKCSEDAHAKDLMKQYRFTKLHVSLLFVGLFFLIQLRDLPAAFFQAATVDIFVAEQKVLINDTSVIESKSTPVKQSSVKRPDDDGVPKVLMVTYNFGENAAQKNYLRLFVETARWSGVDILLLGDYPVSFPLPDNVKHHLVSWDGLVQRIQDNVLNGTEAVKLNRTKNYYKVIDFKPLFAALFPELVEGYDWWGHVDNDLMLGNLRKYLTPEILTNYDVYSGITSEYAWGPFMLYRNTPIINELFRNAERPLAHIFDNSFAHGFDEWGGQLRRKQFNSTMAGIVKHHRARLGIRWSGGIPLMWDTNCIKNRQPLCCGCIFHPPNASTTLQGQPHQPSQLLGNCTNGQVEAAICHFQRTKAAMDESIVNETYLSSLIKHGHIGVDFHSGFYQA